MNQNRETNADKLADTLKEKTKRFKWVIGISNIRRSFGSLNKDASKDKAVNIFMMDDESKKAIKYPLSKGKWFDVQKINGYEPCVIGGYLSNKYKIGDIITAYIPTEQDNVKKEISYMVTGILSKPEKVLSLNLTALNMELPLSLLYKSQTETGLFIVTSLSKVSISSVPYGNVFIYLDKSCPEDTINQLKKEISIAYTKTDTELINDEQKEISHLMSLLLPFIIMLFLVSSCGIISMCMLTTLKNMNQFKIYYITGCTQRRAILVTGIYSLLYFVLSGLLFIGILHYFNTRRTGRIESTLFILNDKSLLIVCISSIAVSVVSFIIPFFLLKRNKPIDMLRIS
ncbi:ABC transporter permease [Ruminiclostridium papyrosolvens DSM 2782]|nr:ABC transporter permease [Ruminiclostridium papyrosolvens]WES34154.1 ABC transporter permease [Ruminiclostridium papyrosolvens DSM 2782]